MSYCIRKLFEGLIVVRITNDLQRDRVDPGNCMGKSGLGKGRGGGNVLWLSPAATGGRCAVLSVDASSVGGKTRKGSFQREGDWKERLYESPMAPTRRFTVDGILDLHNHVFFLKAVINWLT